MLIRRLGTISKLRKIGKINWKRDYPPIKKCRWIVVLGKRKYYRDVVFNIVITICN